MAQLPLLYLPSEILRKKSHPVTGYTAQKYHSLIRDMGETMMHEKGIGLAAPQVGKNIRLTVIHTKDGILALINPVILRRSLRKIMGEEGCLSIPGVFGMVKRHGKITVSAMLEDGTQKVFNAEGLFARVIQHEIDHLDGILFIDRTKKITAGKELLKKYEAKK